MLISKKPFFLLDKKNFYIDGKWVGPLKPNDHEVINPSNEEPYAIISLGTKEDTDAAVKSAKNSFLTWWRTPKEKKLELLNTILAAENLMLHEYLKRIAEMDLEYVLRDRMGGLIYLDTMEQKKSKDKKPSFGLKKAE